MSFEAKTDYFGLGTSANHLSVSDDADGASIQEATALDETGCVCAHEEFGASISPTNTYKLSGDVANVNFILGAVSGATTKVMIGNFTVTTGAGAEPTISVGGEQVESTATTGCKATVPVSVSKVRHAQVLFGIYNASTGLTGDAKLTGATYTGSCEIGKATVDGVCIASDISQPKIVATLNFVQTGSTAPTLTLGSGWAITGALAKTSADASYPTWTCTATKYLAKDSGQ